MTANWSMRSRRLMKRTCWNESLSFCSMAIVLGPKTLGAILLNIPSRMSGRTKDSRPSRPGRSNSRDIFTRALDSAALSVEKSAMALPTPSPWTEATPRAACLSRLAESLTTSSSALLAPRPK